MTNSLQTQIVFFFLKIEFIYYLLVISAHMFFSIIMITSLPDTLVKTKHWNQFAINIPSLASVLIYNNSASPMSLVCNLSYNITSFIGLSNNFLFPNNYGIPFLWTLLRNFHYSLGLTLSWLQLTSLPSRKFLFLFMTLSHL